MFPLLGTIVALFIGLSYPELVPVDRAPDLIGAAVVVLAYAAAARFLTGIAIRRAARRRDEFPVGAMRTSTLLRGGTLLGYWVVIYQCDWPQLVRLIGIRGWVLLPEVIVLLPFFVLLGLQLAAAWTAENAILASDFPLRSYLGFHLRQILLPLLPIFCFLAVKDLFVIGYHRGYEWVANLGFLYTSYAFLQWITLAVGLFVLYCIVPFLMRLFWGAKPLPPGPMRTRLLEFSRREGFRARDILLWPTGGNVLNAAVIGVAAPFRYVLITDALLEALPPDEVEAVFAHEVGHAKHQHMLLFFLFTIGYVLLASLVGDRIAEPASRLIGDRTYLYAVFGIGGFLAWFGIIFGFLSRRFEQQADVYGALATGRVHGESGGDPATHPFVRALEGLGEQMGDIREVKGWRHFSLASRVDFLVAFLGSEETRRRYRRRLTALLFFFFGLLTALGVAAAMTIPEQIRKGRFEAAEQRAQWLSEQGREEEATREYLRAAELRRQAGLPISGGEPDESLRGLVMRLHDQAFDPATPAGERVYRLCQLAVGYLRMQDPARARSVATTALRMAGSQPAILDLLGQALEAEGRPKGARLAWHDALVRLPDDSPLAKVIRARMAAAEPPVEGR